MKRYLKKLIVMLICFVTVISILPVNGLAANVVASGSCGEKTTWKLTDDGRLTISGTGYMSINPWEKYSDSIKSAVIEKGVTSVCDYAFRDCASMTSIEIPDTVTEIGYQAFVFCESLEDILIPNSVTRIDDHVFGYCTSLKGIWVDDKNPVFSSDDRGVLFNKNKSELIFAPWSISGEYAVPNGVKRIRYSAFQGCDLLTSVTIPNGVTEIESEVFWDCRSLKSIAIPDSVKVIGEDAFIFCEALESITLPDGLIEIGDYAFDSCTSLRSITIPKNVSKIGESAFFNCESLTDIRVDEDNTSFCSDSRGVLYDKNKSVLLKAPDRIKGEYTVPNGVATIGSVAFAGCVELLNVTIPDSVTSIGKEAFGWCYSLQSISIPAGTEQIGDRCFYICLDLKEIRVDENNLNYSSDARGVLFDKDQSLLIAAPGDIRGEYVIPDSVTEIGNDAFAGCSSISGISFPKNLKTIGEFVFTFCNSLRVIRFYGNAPDISDAGLSSSLKATAYYPVNNSTWKRIADNNEQFGGKITWVPFNPGQQRGDVDGDGEVGNTDLIMIARYVVEIYTEATKADIEIYGDMNSNGYITNQDIITVARKIVGLA